MKRLCAMSVVLSAALLAACAKNPPAPNTMTQEQINNQVRASLVQSAAQTQASLAELSSIEKTRFQKNNTLPLANINDPALNVVVTLKWNGPIEPLLRQMASLTGYQFQAFGKAPFSPILVNIDDTDNPVSALTIIRNADIQAGLNAQILIYQDEKVISLRYPGS
jgi:defect-in-organelle-trafficking protein DotD